jgi:hypothetical protein
MFPVNLATLQNITCESGDTAEFSVTRLDILNVCMPFHFPLYHVSCNSYLRDRVIFMSLCNECVRTVASLEDITGACAQEERTRNVATLRAAFF